jgi:hypothetical protein
MTTDDCTQMTTDDCSSLHNSDKLRQSRANPPTLKKLYKSLEKFYKWGKKWDLVFLADKSTLLTFSRSRKNLPNPLLFIHERRIPPSKTAKFLGLSFDRKLCWNAHINDVVNYSCLKKKNLFNINIHHKYSPSTYTLATLYKTIISTKIDYGIMAYGGASNSRLSKIDVTTRNILRLILY